jgi:hypothetical protein
VLTNAACCSGGRVPYTFVEVSGACDDAEAYGISLLTTGFPSANWPARGVLAKKPAIVCWSSGP